MKHRLMDTRGARPTPYPTIALPPASRQEEPQENMIEEYRRIFQRHLGLIAICALVGMLLTLAMSLTALPRYTTRTSIDVRNLNSNFMNQGEIEQVNSGGGPDGDSNLQTQIRLLQTESLLTDVQQKLLAEPHPASIPKKDLLSQFMRTLHVGRPGSLPYKDLVADAANHMKVKPLGVTRLVEVTCEAYDAQFAAEFCNTLTTTFQEEDLQSRAADAENTSQWLTKQVADVRVRAEASQKKLEEAVGGNGLMLSQDATAAGEQRLRSLQDELTRAQADRYALEAQAGVAQSAPADTLASVQDNPQHRADEARLADLNAQLAQLTPALTDQNPKVIRLRAEIAEVQADLLATQSNSRQRQTNDLAAAHHREQLLQLAYNAQQAAVSSDLQKAAEVGLLKKELDSEQNLYQTLLQRAKEAGFATAMKAATIRVVDVAKAPKIPSSPRYKTAGGIGLVLGSLFGVGIAFFRERNDKVFRAPGDIPKYLNVQELGVIPAARKLKANRHALALSAGAPAPGEVISLTRWNDSYSIAAEAYRNATLSILLTDSGKRSRSYIVTSPSAGEGKTTVTSNLGVALSKSRLRVVLIDGDLRRPSLHRAFSVENQFGLRDILRGDVDLQSIRTENLTIRTAINNIFIVPAGRGSEDVVELLHSSNFGALLTRLQREFDVVLIDTPPILHMADARIMAGQTDGAILVFRSGQTTHDQAADARDLFDRDGVRLVGTLLNDFDPQRDGRYGYYSSYEKYADNETAQAGAA